jgi:hypothetical protein
MSRVGGPIDQNALLSQAFDAIRGFCGPEEQRDDITATVTRFR